MCEVINHPIFSNSVCLSVRKLLRQSDSPSVLTNPITLVKSVLFGRRCCFDVSLLKACSLQHVGFCKCSQNTLLKLNKIFDILIEREVVILAFTLAYLATGYGEITPVVSHCFCLWHTETLDITNPFHSSSFFFKWQFNRKTRDASELYSWSFWLKVSHQIPTFRNFISALLKLKRVILFSDHFLE